MVPANVGLCQVLRVNQRLRSFQQSLVVTDVDVVHHHLALLDRFHFHPITGHDLSVVDDLLL